MKRIAESYYDAAPVSPVGCAVPGCTEPVAAEVFTGDYSAAMELFRGRRREKVSSRRNGDERIFACQGHLDQLTELRWQLLMPWKEK